MDCKRCLLSSVCQSTGVNDCQFYTDRRYIVELPCKIGDSFYVLQKQADGITRIIRMSVIKIEPFGAMYNAFIYNMYLASDNVFAYKAFADIGRTVFKNLKDAKKERDFINQKEKNILKRKRK